MVALMNIFNFFKIAIIGIGYIQSGNLFPEPLSIEEEKVYIDKFKIGDEQARKVLIEREIYEKIRNS